MINPIIIQPFRLDYNQQKLYFLRRQYRIQKTPRGFKIQKRYLSFLWLNHAIPANTLIRVNRYGLLDTLYEANCCKEALAKQAYVEESKKQQPSDKKLFLLLKK